MFFYCNLIHTLHVVNIQRWRLFWFTEQKCKHVHSAQFLIHAYPLNSLNHVHAVPFCQHIMHLTCMCLQNLLCTSVHTIYWGQLLSGCFFLFNSRCDHYIIHLNILHSVLLSVLQSCSSFAHSLRVIQILLHCSFWEQTIELIKACLCDRVINVINNTNNAVLKRGDSKDNKHIVL